MAAYLKRDTVIFYSVLYLMLTIEWLHSRAPKG